MLALVSLSARFSEVLAGWDWSGELPTWRHDFPDHDCLQLASWNDLRLQVEETNAPMWMDAILDRLDSLKLTEAREVLFEDDLPECALGTLFVLLGFYKVCVQGPSEVEIPCAEESTLSDLIQGMLHKIPLFDLVGTRWPVVEMIDFLELEPYISDPVLACEEPNEDGIDWWKLRDAMLPGRDWVGKGSAIAYHPSFDGWGWTRALDTCLYGFLAASIWKMTICAGTQAACVDTYLSTYIETIREKPWQEVVSNPWRIFGFLSDQRSGLRRHGFFLDFSGSELRGELPSAKFPTEQAIFEPISGDLAADVEVSVSYADALKTVLAGIPKVYVSTSDTGSPEVGKLLYVTMVFGPRYVPYIPRFVARAQAVGIDNLAIFCLDEAALESCRALPGPDERCIRGTPSIMNKFTLPLVFLHLGVDVFWLDFDVFILQDPTKLVLDTMQQRRVELLVSGSFADDCICSGLVYFKATKVVAEWLLTLLSFMYENVYTHDQQAFSAFLAWRPDEDDATTPEIISSDKHFRKYMRPEAPRWALLDPVVQFPSARVLNTTGFTGDVEDIYIFHFLHGDSEVNRDHGAYGWNVNSGYTGGGSIDRAILDIFYDQKDERIYTEASAPLENIEVRKALMASWRPFRPTEMLHCGPVPLKDDIGGF